MPATTNCQEVRAGSGTAASDSASFASYCGTSSLSCGRDRIKKIGLRKGIGVRKGEFACGWEWAAQGRKSTPVKQSMVG